MFDDWINSQVLNVLPRPYKQVGRTVTCRCPICGDSHKSKLKMRGTYYLDNSSYYCFNCGASCGGLYLLAKLTGHPYGEVKTEYFRQKFESGGRIDLSASAGYQRREIVIKDVSPANKLHDLSEKAKAYLEGRKIFSAPFIGSEKFYSVYGKAPGAEFILIPWNVGGVMAYFQLNDFLKIDPRGRKYIFPASMQKLVYGLDKIDTCFPYIICFEGVYDSLFMKNGVAIGGKSLTDAQLKLIQERYPRHEIVMALDNDAPGLSATKSAIDKGLPVKFIKWYDAIPPAYKDINDYVKATGDCAKFTDVKYIESLIRTPALMRLDLIENGLS